VALVNEPRLRPLLGVTLVLLPALAAGNVFLGSRETLEAPAFGRTVHPAPPDTIPFGDKTIDLAKGQNPLRELETKEPERYRAHVENGRKTYYQNCHFCHGDALAGDGMYAHGLNPIPTNFTDPGTIAQLQESFLFWRIAKGGPGLPAEGGPWDSAMPAWEKFLKEEEIWEVILFLYDHTGQRPRASGVEH
jgi:mono/diheme cytochrome c family protein